MTPTTQETLAAPVLAPPDHIEAPSPRERDILGLLVLGLSNRDIAVRLGLSEKTIKNNLTRIYEKLKVTNRAEAIVACLQYRLG